MSYVIERAETVGDAARRIAHEQLGDAIEALRELIEDDPHDSIHDARKRCKKVRGVIRLVRPAVGAATYQEVNGNLRDAAGELSATRDATAMCATFDELVRSDDHAPDGGVHEVGAWLAQRREHASASIGSSAPEVAEALRLIELVDEGVEAWSLAASGWSALTPGMTKTYGRGRKALRVVRSSPTGDNFHTWRKRVKYTWYHLRLVALASPAMIGPLADRFHDVSELLGDAHDLRVLAEQLRSAGDDAAPRHGIDSTIRFVEGHRVQLERRAVALGSRLYVEPKDAFADRMGGYWAIWKELGAEPRLR